MSKPKVISYSLYPFVEQAIRDAGYEVFNTNRSSKDVSGNYVAIQKKAKGQKCKRPN